MISLHYVKFSVQIYDVSCVIRKKIFDLMLPSDLMMSIGPLYVWLLLLSFF